MGDESAISHQDDWAMCSGDRNIFTSKTKKLRSNITALFFKCLGDKTYILDHWAMNSEETAPQEKRCSGRCRIPISTGRDLTHPSPLPWKEGVSCTGPEAYELSEFMILKGPRDISVKQNNKSKGSPRVKDYIYRVRGYFISVRQAGKADQTHWQTAVNHLGVGCEAPLRLSHELTLEHISVSSVFCFIFIF